MNKKYVALITIGLIAHITNTEQDKPADSLNYSKKQIEKDYGPSLSLFLKSIGRGISTNPEALIEIEDNEGTDHVKVIVRDIGEKSSLAEEETGSETFRIIYDKQIRLLSVYTLKEQMVEEREGQEDQVSTLYYGATQESSLRLRSAINLGQRKTDYNKEKRELTITIPRIIEQTKKTAGNGE